MSATFTEFTETLPLPPLGDEALRQRVQAALDHKTKPLGALGRLETLALQLALVLRHEKPQLLQPQLVVFAADHGIAAQGVSAYPAEVTRQMVLNFLSGGAAVSVLARQHGLALTVADCGVAAAVAELAAHPLLVRLNVPGAEHGSADSTQAPAMSRAQCETALGNGRRLVASLPGNVLLLGEMGIANTSAAALLMARLTGEPLAQCVGRGTGLNDAGLARKRAVLQRALDRHADARAPLDALAALGGLEIATMVGAVQQAAALGRVIVVDGFIATAAVAVAAALQPEVLARCVFAHCSQEAGHARWLQSLRVPAGGGQGVPLPSEGLESTREQPVLDAGVQPLLQLDLRLGEGSGAALAWPLLESACRILAEMASFESAGVGRERR